MFIDMKLFIIRHGETFWNRERRLQGQEGTDLDEKGIRLAEVTSEAMRDIPMDLCITSPLLRARHTAEIMTRGRGIPVIEDPRIEEIAFGEWEGKHCMPPKLEIPADQWSVFFRDPFHFVPPKGGEAITDVIRRTAAFLQDVLSNPLNQTKNILISTHGCAMRALLNPYYDDPGDFWQGGVPKNCAVSQVVVKDGRAKLTVSDRIYYRAEEDAWQAIYAAEKKAE
jgi:probable phosphoglycerate mutase